MIGWQLNRIAENAEKLKNYIRCRRCGLYFRKKLEKCNYCSHLSDLELREIIAKRRSFRLNLAKLMFAGALVIIVLMIFL